LATDLMFVSHSVLFTGAIWFGNFVFFFRVVSLGCFGLVVINLASD